MARLRWIEDSEADEATARSFDEVRKRRSRVPPVMRTMSLRPDVMVQVARLADTLHFSDGFLDRRTKEKIATYVSALNSCGYCATSHRVFLETAGEQQG
ncbi:MAG TPA: carboxymuconolactone decarboxylase family protein, partial [Acidimicrobiales bacterium]|nr:carboxymuconolactone decarboxylase family protein [Acidimicrobiales bacterium]